MVYILSYNNMNEAEAALAISLQGVINRTNKEVFIDVDKYIDYLKDEDRIYTDIYSLVEKYKEKLEGFVTYDLNDSDVGINMAAMISAAYDVIGVPRTLEDKITAVGLKRLYDLKDVTGSNAQRQRKIFDACLDKMNKNGLVHEVVAPGNFHIRLRDLSIVNRWACIYTSESEEDREFRKYVLEKLDKNIAIYGWNDDEIAFIKDISTFGDYCLPSDWSCNHSYFESSDAVLKQTRKEAPIAKNKHYVALVVSDGDNIQWLERTFLMPDGSFGQRKASGSDKKYKMTWTFSPSMVRICPDGAKHIYEHAGLDYFISGVSGVGYANCLEYPEEHLGSFTSETAEMMKRSDLSVVCLLDNIKNTENCNFVKQRLHFYSRFDNIKGGIWELDPDRYGSGKGKIFWSDGKPFVSVRFTMWYPTCRMEDVTYDWLDRLAEEVNAMPICPDKEEGYTVVNVHPWTMTQDSVDYFVSKLDKDKIELVYADELINLVKGNVKEKE